MALRQVLRWWKQPLIGPFRRVRRLRLDQIAFHPINMFARFDPVIAAEQPGQAGMADRDVQMVRIIVCDRLPVDRPRTERHSPDRSQLLEAVRRDLRLIGRHHLRD